MLLTDATPNSRGFTLVEVLISMLVLLIGLLGSLIGVMAAADYNLGNALRTEAVRIVQEQLENIRVGRFDTVPNGNFQLQRQVRKTMQSYQVTIAAPPPPLVGAAGGTIRQVTVTVQWTFKGRTRSFSSATIIRQRVFN
jgi:type IV pilus assembly protein PilV